MMTELPVERLYSTPIPGEEGLVALTVIFKDPETGEEWPEHYPRVRVGGLGMDADGQHRYTLTTLQPGGQQWEFKGASE